MPVRPATDADLDLVADLIRALADYEHLAHEVVFDREDLRRHLFGAHPVASVLLAVEDDGTPAGFALHHASFSTFLGRPGIWLEDLFVLADHRGRGHGRALVEALHRRTDGRLEWSVLDWNEDAVAFYRHLGARPVEGWTRYRL